MVTERWWHIRASVNHEIKVFQIWCTEDERNIEGFFELVEQLVKKHNIDPKYKRVIYISGEKNLIELTADLLRQNKDYPTMQFWYAF